MNVIDRVIECLTPKTQAELARVCSQKPQAVTRWRKTGRVPAVHCRLIEQATGGRMTCHELRPDVFGEAPATDMQEAG